MNRQEKIREWLLFEITEIARTGTWIDSRERTHKFLTFLDSEGVVISMPDSPDTADDTYYGDGGPPTIRNGWCLVEPLIKEGE